MFTQCDKSMLYARDPQGYVFPGCMPSPPVKEMHYTRLKSQKDFVLFLPQTERFRSGSRSIMNPVQAEI